MGLKKHKVQKNKFKKKETDTRFGSKKRWKGRIKKIIQEKKLMFTCIIFWYINMHYICLKHE